MTCANCFGKGLIQRHTDNWFGYEEKFTTHPCPVCVPQPLTARQLEALSSLPEERGWYWVQRLHDGFERPVLIDRPAVTSNICDSHVIEDSTCFSGSDQNIRILIEWLEKNVVLGLIPPFRHPEPPPNYGIF